MNPYPFTMRRLIEMAKARRLAEWRRFASLMAYVMNANQFVYKGHGEWTAEEIYPDLATTETRPRKAGIRLTCENFKTVFASHYN